MLGSSAPETDASYLQTASGPATCGPPVSRALPSGLPRSDSPNGGTRPLSSTGVGGDPSAAAYDSANGLVYVANALSDNVSVLNGTVVVATVAVGSDPAFEAYDGRNGFVYVSNYASDNVTVISGFTVIGTVKVGTGPGEVTYDSSNGFIYVVNAQSANVSVISGTGLQGTASVGNEPISATFDSGNGYVYVSNLLSGSISVIDGTSSIHTVAVGQYPEYAAYDSSNGYLYVPDYGSSGVSIINGTTLVLTIPIGTDPDTSTYVAETGFVYVTQYGSSNVSVIDGMAVVGKAIAGSTPQFPVYDSGNGLVYVPDYGSGNVTVIQGTKAVGSISVGVSPVVAAYDPGNGYLYVMNSRSHFVTIIVTGYTITFTETGLAAGSRWTVSLNGTEGSSTSSNISLAKPNGTYSYTVGNVPGYSVSSGSGTVTLSGANRTIAVPFLPLTYPVEFFETGLPLQTNWTAMVGGTRGTSDLSSITFLEPNGVYDYQIGGVPGWATSNYTGSLTVQGAAISTDVDWTKVTYNVTFAESGLPSGDWWMVNLSGSTLNSTSIAISFEEPNGSYTFTLRTEGSYQSPSPSPRSVQVDGANREISVTFLPPVSTCCGEGFPTTPVKTFLGLPPTEGYALLAGIVGAIAAGAIVSMLWIRRRKAAPSPPRPDLEVR
jgi:YVTN family beta-propeller protein